MAEDVQKGWLRKELKHTKYGKIFDELTYKQGVLLQQHRMVIQESLQADVLALAHEGHPGVEQMLRHLRQGVW